MLYHSWFYVYLILAYQLMYSLSPQRSGTWSQKRQTGSQARHLMSMLKYASIIQCDCFPYMLWVSFISLSYDFTYIWNAFLRYPTLKRHRECVMLAAPVSGSTRILLGVTIIASSFHPSVATHGNSHRQTLVLARPLIYVTGQFLDTSTSMNNVLVQQVARFLAKHQFFFFS